jgi:hypothetical protein
MTKAENRTSAKAYREEQMKKMRDESRAKNVEADLNGLNKLRNYLLFDSRTRVSGLPLMDAIDDYVEKLTGDRTTLHAKSCSIGPIR